MIPGVIQRAAIAAVLGGLFFLIPVLTALLLVPRGPAGPAFTVVDFASLTGWQADDHGASLATFQKVCETLQKRSPEADMRPRRIGGKVADWLPACEAATAAAIAGMDSRQFFETSFTPLAISVSGEREGQFTGYYEPIYEGSLVVTPEYPIPLYRRPPDLVTADLGLFRADLDGRRIAGRLQGGQLKPFESRAEIEGGALSGQGLELLWLKDPVDAFFLHIQGSGRVRLADGSLLKVGYAGPNGHPNTMIGRLLVERGEVALADMSMQAIRDWINAHPAEGARLMRRNASFIFFRLLQGDNPIGSLGTELTPRRSLAVDRSHLPLGAPYWVETTRPDAGSPEGLTSFNRLMIGEDTGGAIRGAVRGDIFWGRGDDAEYIAGHMASPGRMFILLPRALAASLAGPNQAD